MKRERFKTLYALSDQMRACCSRLEGAGSLLRRGGRGDEEFAKASANWVMNELLWPYQCSRQGDRRVSGDQSAYGTADPEDRERGNQRQDRERPSRGNVLRRAGRLPKKSSRKRGSVESAIRAARGRDPQGHRANPGQAADYKAGKVRQVCWGSSSRQVMKETKGQAIRFIESAS